MGLLYDVLETLKADMDRPEPDSRQLLRQLLASAGAAGQVPGEKEEKPPRDTEEKERSAF